METVFTQKQNKEKIRDLFKKSEQFNWWTEDKNEISEITKIGYILQYGNHKDLNIIFNNFDLKVIKEAFENVKDDNFKMKSHRKYIIEHLIKKLED